VIKAAHVPSPSVHVKRVLQSDFGCPHGAVSDAGEPELIAKGLFVLSRSLFLLKDADRASMWPEAPETTEIVRFVREELKRPG